MARSSLGFLQLICLIGSMLLATNDLAKAANDALTERVPPDGDTDSAWQARFQRDETRPTFSFDRARGAMVGSDEYLTKPFTKDSLLKTVKNYTSAT